MNVLEVLMTHTGLPKREVVKLTNNGAVTASFNTYLSSFTKTLDYGTFHGVGKNRYIGLSSWVDKGWVFRIDDTLTKLSSGDVELSYTEFLVTSKKTECACSNCDKN